MRPARFVRVLAVLAELLDGLDEAVERAAHVVELSADEAGLERVLDELVDVQRLALGDDGTEELRLRLRVDALDEVILELGLDAGHDWPPFIFSPC